MAKAACSRATLQTSGPVPGSRARNTYSGPWIRELARVRGPGLLQCRLMARLSEGRPRTVTLDARALHDLHHGVIVACATIVFSLLHVHSKNWPWPQLATCWPHTPPTCACGDRGAASEFTKSGDPAMARSSCGRQHLHCDSSTARTGHSHSMPLAGRTPPTRVCGQQVWSCGYGPFELWLWCVDVPQYHSVVHASGPTL